MNIQSTRIVSTQNCVRQIKMSLAWNRFFSRLFGAIFAVELLSAICSAPIHKNSVRGSARDDSERFVT